MRQVKRWCLALPAVLVLAGSALGARDPGTSAAWPSGTAVISYESEQALAAALDHNPAQVVRRIRALQVVALRPAGSVERFAQRIGAEPGIVRVDRAAARRSRTEPALAAPAPGLPYQWQFAAVRADQVPPAVAQAAAAYTIAVIDTGADLTAPDLSAKTPHTYSLRSRLADVPDTSGHGTFVAALAAGSSTNGDGIAGVGGDAGLMVVQAGGSGGAFTDVDEAAAIVYAVDHGAKIVNLSLGGSSTSAVEKRAVDYATAKGVLLVAAVGNGYLRGNEVEYPAALLQPVGSRGVGGSGLSVAASTLEGRRAAFSNTGSHVSLAAPGVGVFSAVSSASPVASYPRTALPGSLGGVYGYGSGTSFASPQVAGAAALVWAANPQLRAGEVAGILEQTATGNGSWNPGLGYGVLDVAAAVAKAQVTTPSPAPAVAPRAPAVRVQLHGKRVGTRVALWWRATGEIAGFRVSVRTSGRPVRILTAAATRRSAVYTLAPGAYRFIVAALDAEGRQLAVSRPWSVTVPRAR
ncbi:MAG TPA: S8 family serine peptidase [Gaiellaceae bacterium]|nr:S8 family serine peptidase [Gaiellaceae bacterium]